MNMFHWSSSDRGSDQLANDKACRVKLAFPSATQRSDVTCKSKERLLGYKNECERIEEGGKDRLWWDG